MTIFGWDASHYDGSISVNTLTKAKNEGVVFFTHKIGEGLSNTDATQGTVLANARSAGIPFLGGYYIPHQGTDPVKEAQRCVALADQHESWWREFGGWFWQCDAERWSSTDRVTAREVKLFCDTIFNITGRLVICYASRGQYHDDLIGLAHPLWNASYGSNPVGSLKNTYPGDTSSGWTSYSGQVPVILQFGSNITIADQTTCDGNAFRGTVSDLRTLIEGDTMSVGDLTRMRDDADFYALLRRQYTMMHLLSTEFHDADSSPCEFSLVIKSLAADSATIKSKLDALSGASVLLTDAQVDQVANNIATALVSSTANQLTSDDHAAIVQDVISALRAGTGE